MKINDLTGIRFGRLVVTGFSHRVDSNRDYIWNCICDCGKKIAASRRNLKSGNTKSCGCLQKDRASTANLVHGGGRTRLYDAWKGMRQRCKNPNHIAYKYYGSRGIRVCEEWDNNFPSFRKWAISMGYPRLCSIDRINPDGNYEPSNCQLLTKSENTAKGNKQRAGMFYSVQKGGQS